MEIVLGIDNVVFIAILVAPPARRPSRRLARRLGLILALGIRVRPALRDLVDDGAHRAAVHACSAAGCSGRDLILLGGGLFLIAKATWEIYDKVEAGHDERTRRPPAAAPFAWVLFQILLLDIVFSLDSVITAVGMANHLSDHGHRDGHRDAGHAGLGGRDRRGSSTPPEREDPRPAVPAPDRGDAGGGGDGPHIDKGYIYFAMAFSLLVEMLNLRYRKTRRPAVTLGSRYRP